MWLALERSGPVTMGAIAIAESVPFILIGSFGARLLQRCASFRLLAGIDCARMLLVAVAPLLWSLGGTPAVLVLAAVLGMLAALFDPSLGALVPDLVDDEERPELVAAMDLNGRIARIAGPALAGVMLLLVPVPALFVADSVTFAVSVLALAYLAEARPPHASFSDSRDVKTLPAVMVSARSILRSQPALAAAFAVHAAGFFLNALPAIGLPLLLSHQLDAGPAAYGWVLTATGTAALVGNLVAARLRPAAFLPTFCTAWAASGLSLVATGAAHNLALVIAFASLSGFVSPFISITLGTQLAGHDHPVRLRLLTVNHTVMRSAGTAGMAVIPMLVAPAPARRFVLGGTALALIAVTAWALMAAYASRARAVRAYSLSLGVLIIALPRKVGDQRAGACREPVAGRPKLRATHRLLGQQRATARRRSTTTPVEPERINVFTTYTTRE